MQKDKGRNIHREGGGRAGDTEKVVETAKEESQAMPMVEEKRMVVKTYGWTEEERKNGSVDVFG